MKCFFILSALVFSASSLGMPIATEVALPVAKSQGIVRLKMSVNSKTQMNVHLLGLAYGFDEDTTLMTMIPYLSGTSRSGIADVPVLLRRTLIKSDEYLKTFRLAVIGGVVIPSWVDSISTKNTSIQGGGVMTYQNGRHEFDTDLIYTSRIPTEHFQKGNLLAYDIAYQIRIFPWDLQPEGVSTQWNLDFELNGTSEGQDKLNGLDQSITGGDQLYFSTGLQWVSTSLVVEALYQIPTLNHLNSDRPQGHQYVFGIRTLAF